MMWPFKKKKKFTCTSINVLVDVAKDNWSATSGERPVEILRVQHSSDNSYIITIKKP